MENRLVIDNDAKLRCPLFKIPRDSLGLPYYIGKLQFPGTLDFEDGISFMVFVSEEGNEELQIGPMDPMKRSKSRKNGVGMKTGGKLVVDLRPFVDGHGKTMYVGEGHCPGKIDCKRGIFLTIFLSREGQEEIQIGRLDHSVNNKRRLLKAGEDELPPETEYDQQDP